MKVSDYKRHVKEVEQHARNAERNAAEVSSMLVQLNNRLHLEERKLLESKNLVAKAETHVDALRSHTSTLKRKLGALYKQYLELSGRPVESSRASGAADSSSSAAERETLPAEAGAFWRAQVHDCVFASSDPELVMNHFQLLDEMYGAGASIEAKPPADLGSTGIDKLGGGQPIDAFSPVCPFELQGRCNDATCPYQHLDRESANFGNRATSSEERRRALRRSMVKSSPQWLSLRPQAYGPAPRLASAPFASSIPQPRWVQELLDNVGDVVCAGCSDSADWGITAIMRLYRFSQHPDTLLLAAQSLKGRLDSLEDDSEEENEQSAVEAAAWAQYAMVVSRLKVGEKATGSLLLQVLTEVYRRHPSLHLVHLAILSEIDRVDPAFLLKFQLSPSATQDQRFLLLLTQVRTLFARGLLLTAVNRLAQALGLEPIFASRNQAAPPFQVDESQQRLVAWATLAYAVTTGEFAGLRLALEPNAAFVPPPDASPLVARFRRVLSGNAELARRFHTILSSAAAEIGIAVLDLDPTTRTLTVSLNDADDNDDAAGTLADDLPQGPVQCLCFCILLFAEASSACINGFDALHAVCPLEEARHIYPTRILESMLSSHATDSAVTAVAGRHVPRLVAAAQAGLLAPAAFDQLAESLDSLSDSSLQDALEFWAAWRPKYVQGPLELTNFACSLDKLCDAVEPLDFVTVVALAMREALHSSNAIDNLVPALHVLVSRAVQLLVCHAMVAETRCAHALGVCDWLGCDEACSLVAQYLQLLELHRLLTIETIAEVLHMALECVPNPAPVLEWYENWCSGGRLRYAASKLLLARIGPCELARLPVEAVAVLVRTLIEAMDVDVPQLWQAIRVLAESHHHEGLATLVRVSFELGVGLADLHLDAKTLLQGSTCTPLWDPVLPSQLDQFALRKLLRVLCGGGGDSAKSLVLRGSLSGVLPSCVFHLRQLEELALSHNSLMTVPRSISRLRGLTILDLSFNALTSLPAELCELVALKLLDVSNNQLAAVPNNIRKLTNLRILRVQHNRLQSLPVGLLSLNGLRELDISNNLLQTVPRGLAERLSLSAFHAEGNPGFESTPTA